MRKALVGANKIIESKANPLSNIISNASYSVNYAIHKPNEKYTRRE